jgi:hypothetical protein
MMDPGLRIAGMTALLLISTLGFASPAKVILSTTTLLPGETLRVELDGMEHNPHLKAILAGKTYPFFAVGPNAQRALIGIRLDAKPGSYGLAFKVPPAFPAGRDDLPTEPYMIEIATKVFTIENVNFTEEKTSLMTSEHREAALIHQANLYLSRDQQWEGDFRYPVDGPIIGEFGLKRTRNNGTIDAGFHKGIDLKADKGTPALAANSGTVVLASNFKAHGKTVMLNHGQGVMTIYLHLSSISVKLRQRVHKGQEIGKVGATGLATAPHVHYQVFVHGVPVDPKQWAETEF